MNSGVRIDTIMMEFYLTLMNNDAAVTIDRCGERHNVVGERMSNALARCRVKTERLMDDTVEIWKLEQRSDITI
jgi:hypothetical protein